MTEAEWFVSAFIIAVNTFKLFLHIAAWIALVLDVVVVGVNISFISTLDFIKEFIICIFS